MTLSVAVGPADGVASSATLTTLYATETGNAERVACDIAAAAAGIGIDARPVNMAEADPSEMAALDRVLIIASTYGDGEAPNQADRWYAALAAADMPRLDGLHYAVLALGDRAYPDFCGFGHKLDARLRELGATPLAEVAECDFDFADTAAAWTGDMLARLAPADGEDHRAEDIHRALTGSSRERDAPFAATILGHRAMHGPGSCLSTAHVELSLEGAGFAYEPGDAVAVMPHNDPYVIEALLAAARCTVDDALADELTLARDITTLTQPMLARYAGWSGSAELTDIAADEARARDYIAGRQLIDLLRDYPTPLDADALLALLRPLAPRSYSIASSRAAVGDRLDLLVTRMSWRDGEGETRLGVASNFIIGRRGVGDSLLLQHKPNSHFHLPDGPATPLVMIGPGTGIAPFRGFLQQRRAAGAGGRNWLFFGHRHGSQDYFYRDELEAMERDGFLKLDLAFSRDQAERIYVQHRLYERRDELLAWIDEGAVLYVCGSIAMGHDVDAMLGRIFAEAGRDPVATLAGLKQAHRYRKDVY